MSERTVRLKFGSNPPVMECKFCRVRRTASEGLSYEEILKEVDRFEKNHKNCRRGS